MLLILFAVREQSERKQIFNSIYCFIYHVNYIFFNLITKSRLKGDVKIHDNFSKIYLEYVIY